MKIISSILLFVFIFVLGFTATAQVKIVDEMEVPIYQRGVITNMGCYGETIVYDEVKFKKLLLNKRCFPLNEFEVDFTKLTLIGWRNDGDCDFKSETKIFRNDTTKIYYVRNKRINGRCSVRVSSSEWFAVDKIPSDYKVEFSQVQEDYVSDK
jgi:hypothetical protein